ncbi:MAG: peptidylprolyl isomerase [Xanthomonadales bacterium]|nr:peptidylprolyl isomerase [Xanthomonadales bacterium]
MKQAKIQILAAVMLLPLFAFAQTEGEPIDSIVALVEEGVILQSELDQAIDAIEQQVRARGENLPPRSVMEEQVLERLIMQRLQVQRAEQTGIRVSDADVDNALNRVAQQNNLSLPQLRRALEQDGIDFEEFRREIRNEILTSRLQQRVVNSMDPISETEIDILLASERFSSQEYLLSQIVISVPDSAGPDEVREAQSRVEEVYQRIEDGMTFGAAAISYSQGPDALEGGDVGWRNASALPSVFADALAELEPGEITEPMRTTAGFVILKLRDARERSEVMVEEYRARHLVVSPSELVSPEQAREQVQNLKRRIEQGEDFAELAREYSSEQSTANLGGLLEWFPAGGYGRPIQQAIDSLEPGEVSEPFQSEQGWHLVKLLDVREIDRTEEVRRSEAREMLSQQKSQEELDRFMRQMRSEAFVEIRL